MFFIIAGQPMQKNNCTIHLLFLLFFNVMALDAAVMYRNQTQNRPGGGGIPISAPRISSFRSPTTIYSPTRLTGGIYGPYTSSTRTSLVPPSSQSSTPPPSTTSSGRSPSKTVGGLLKSLAAKSSLHVAKTQIGRAHV
jgi:hypothetical protein